MKKTRLNRLKYFKKLTVSVRFHKPETEKPNKKKPSQIETKPIRNLKKNLKKI
jgi:hypothetical protein